MSLFVIANERNLAQLRSHTLYLRKGIIEESHIRLDFKYVQGFRGTMGD